LKRGRSHPWLPWQKRKARVIFRKKPFQKPTKREGSEIHWVWPPQWVGESWTPRFAVKGVVGGVGRRIAIVKKGKKKVVLQWGRREKKKKKGPTTRKRTAPIAGKEFPPQEGKVRWGGGKWGKRDPSRGGGKILSRLLVPKKKRRKKKGKRASEKKCLYRARAEKSFSPKKGKNRPCVHGRKAFWTGKKARLKKTCRQGEGRYIGGRKARFDYREGGQPGIPVSSHGRKERKGKNVAF